MCVKKKKSFLTHEALIGNSIATRRLWPSWRCASLQGYRSLNVLFCNHQQQLILLLRVTPPSLLFLRKSVLVAIHSSRMMLLQLLTVAADGNGWDYGWRPPPQCYDYLFRLKTPLSLCKPEWWIMIRPWRRVMTYFFPFLIWSRCMLSWLQPLLLPNNRITLGESKTRPGSQQKASYIKGWQSYDVEGTWFQYVTLWG